MNANINNFKFYKGKKVFITGHTGFKGAWLCMLLNYIGADITGYALRAEQGSLFEKARVEESIHHIEGDIRDFDALNTAVIGCQPEIVIHLAALAQVKDCYDNPICAYSTNVIGTVNLLEALKTCTSCKSIIIVTTDKVYENKGDGAVYCEDDLLGGSDPYSTSKTSMELIVKAYRECYFQNDYDQIGLATVRASNVIGGGDHVESRLIPSILNAVEKGENIEIRNPLQTRPWQSVLDALNGYLTIGRLLFLYPEKYSESWNIGPTIDGIRTVSWIFEKIEGYYSGIKSVSGDKIAVKESATLGLDIQKALDRLDWKPIISSDEMIKLVVDFFMKQKSGMPERDICKNQIDYFFRKDIQGE